MSLSIPRPRSLKARIATVAAAGAIVAGGFVAVADPASATTTRKCYAPVKNEHNLDMRPRTTSSAMRGPWGGGYKVRNNLNRWVEVSVQPSKDNNLYCKGSGVTIYGPVFW
jgi:hypothetical protein